MSLQSLLSRSFANDYKSGVESVPRIDTRLARANSIMRKLTASFLSFSILLLISNSIKELKLYMEVSA